MGEAFKHQLLSMLKRQKNRRHRALKVLSLCLLVAIVTATALRMPGEAMTHTSRVLACSLQGSAEPVVHTHNTDCYDENGALVCPLPERASHTHTEACYDENGALICGQEEITTEHIHNEACFYTVELTDEEVATINDTEAAAAPEPAGAPASETPANVMADMPVQEIEESIPGGALRVHVSAPAGALPAGTAIQILNIYPDGLPDDHVVRTEHGVILTGRGADVLFIANGEIVHPAIPVAAKLIIDNITVNAGMVYVEDADADHDVTEEDACYRIVILPSEEALLPRTDAATEEAPVPAEPDQTVTAAETDTAAETVDVNEAMPEQIFDADTDEGVHVHVVAPEGAFPAGTVMNVTDIDDADVLDTIANAVEGTVRSMQAVDITFTYEDDAIEPLVPVAVSLTSAAVSENASVVHVDHEGEATVVEDVNVTEDSAVFDADAFSVYAVVDITLEDTIITSDGQNYHITATYGPETGIPADAVLDVREVTEGDTAYDIGYEDYVANTEAALGMEAGSAAYIRLFDIKIVDAEDPEIQYQPAEGTTVDVRIELADAEPAEDETLNVVHFADGAAEGDVVEVTESENQAVRFAAGAFSVYGVVSSGATTNLDGKTFALINTYDNNAVLGGTQNNNTRLAAASVQISNGRVISAEDDITMWTFRSAGNGKYYIQPAGDDEHYLTINGNNPRNGAVTLSTTRQALNVTAGTGNHSGTVRIHNDNGVALNNYNHSTSDGFGPGNWNNDDEYLTLFDMFNLNVYVADKISVQDLEDTQEGNPQKVVIYRSVYNETTNEYEDYAIAGDGTLVRAYDKGDRVGVQTTLAPEMTQWEVTIHRDATTGEPNGYYDFRNVATGNYLSPQSNGSLVSPTRPGVTLDGRRDGKYNSTIEAWDNATMAYYGGQIVKESGNFVLKSATGDASQEFSFAEVTEHEANQLHPVETVDSTSKGITIRVFDYPNRQYISNITGSDSWAAGRLPASHVAATLNAAGYPQFVRASDSTSTPSNNGQDGRLLFAENGGNYIGRGNNLFLSSVYNATGYYEYSSFHNFASYANGSFTVYEELGVPNYESSNPDEANRYYYQRGNFLPFNTLNPNAPLQSHFNQNDSEGNIPLPSDDPTNGENLYAFNEGTNYYFGMTMEAAFMQPQGGCMNGNPDEPILYEFNGDDDLWIYVDGVLLLDIGGVHDAFQGSINFETGRITGGNFPNTSYPRTIKTRFWLAHRFPDGSAWTNYNDPRVAEFFDGETFADYSSHEFKMFYMEHGAGASNLDMRFNLPVIRTGTFTVEKELTGSVQDEYANVDFAYQAFRKVRTGESTSGAVLINDGIRNGYYIPLTAANYEGTTNAVTFHDGVALNGATYDHVFYLRPGEAATFTGLQSTDEYFAREIDILTDDYDLVTINGEAQTVQADGVYSSTDAMLRNRARLLFENRCSVHNQNDLRIRKLLEGGCDSGDTLFEFRVLLENSRGELVPYYRGYYYLVRNIGGTDHYYYYQNGQLTEQNLGPEEQPAYASQAGPNGTIQIPAGYTIVIPNLLVGTDFFVEEIRLPSGWELSPGGKVVVPNTCGPSEMQGISFDNTTITADGQILKGAAYHAEVDFTNRTTSFVTVTKNWSTGTLSVTQHGDIQIALFAVGENDSLTYIDGTLRTLSTPAGANTASLEYHMNTLPTDYVVREVTVTGTGDQMTVTPIAENTVVGVSGEAVAWTQTDSAEGLTDSYIVTYPNANTIANTMRTLTVNKTNESGDILPDAMFRLLQADKETVVPGYEEIHSTGDENGNLLNGISLPNGTYYLEETAAPDGYNRLASLVRIVVGNDGITMNMDGGSGMQTVYQNSGDTVAYKYSVQNNSGVELPETGGIGTLPVYLIGAGAILGAGGTLLVRRKARR